MTYTIHMYIINANNKFGNIIQSNQINNKKIKNNKQNAMTLTSAGGASQGPLLHANAMILFHIFALSYSNKGLLPVVCAPRLNDGRKRPARATKEEQPHKKRETTWV